jgi:HEAT repeat protein
MILAEDEPSFLGKKLSAWISDLETGKDAKARRRGLIGIEQIGPNASRNVVPALLKALREDKDADVRAAAARSLGRVVAKWLDKARADKKEELPKFEPARDALASALRTEKEDAVREAAALALSEFAPDARGVIASLSNALKDKHTPTVRASISALRRMGKDARDVEPEVRELLANAKADPEARVEAATCLGQFLVDMPRCLPIFLDIVKDPKAAPALRKAVIDTLGKQGKDGADSTAALAFVLMSKEKDVTPELRIAAVTALNQFDSAAKEAIPALIKVIDDLELNKIMGDNARFLRPQAMHALGKMAKDLDTHRKQAVLALIKATDDPNVDVCVSAIETLGVLAADGFAGEREEVIKKFEAILVREGRKAIRDAVTASQAKLNPKK